MRDRKVVAWGLSVLLGCELVLATAVLPFALPSLLGTAGAQVSKKNVQVPFASAARTASVDSSTFEILDADALVCYLSVTASSGTSPTLDVKFQDSPDGVTWFDVAGTSFTQVTGSSSSQVISATRKFSRRIRCRVTIAGTSPSFTFAVWFMAQ